MAATVRPPELSVSASRFGPHVSLDLRGEFDLGTAPIFDRAVDKGLARGALAMAVDLRELSFIDTSGVHALTALAKRARREGFVLGVVPGSNDIMRVFDVTCTTDALPFRRAA